MNNNNLKLYFIVCNNLYASKFHFTEKLAEALKRIGVDTKCLYWSHGPVSDEVLQTIEKEKPTLTLSFNQVARQGDGEYFFDKLKIPHLTMLLDPAIYDIDYATSLYSLISCVDHNDCEFFRAQSFEKVFFFPHAIEKDITIDLHQKRPIDVAFIGTCYDPDGLHEWWKKNYPKDITNIIERAVHIALSDNKTSIYEAVKDALIYHSTSPKDVDVLRIFYYVDFYMRGIERIELIRSIKDAQVHVYGGNPIWREEPILKNWNDYFSNQKNVITHNSVNYSESLEILKQTKICLNSSPMFKNGSHERIFASLACGSFLITTDSLYVQDHFIEDIDLYVFQFNELNKVNEKINYLLANEEVRLDSVCSGRNKVLENHTWDNRAKLLLESILRFVC